MKSASIPYHLPLDKASDLGVGCFNTCKITTAVDTRLDMLIDSFDASKSHITPPGYHYYLQLQQQSLLSSVLSIILHFCSVMIISGDQ